MKRIGNSFFIMVLLAAFVVGPVAAQSEVSLLAPKQGEVLQGVVTIRGTNAIQGFGSSELDFAYSDDTTGTWFLIVTSDQPAEGDILATWDTTTISDGNYTLRLRVTMADGSFQDATVTDLRVRNYTAVETPTPAPTQVQPTPLPTVTMTPIPFPTPTGLPRNPADITPSDVSLSLVYGGVGAVVLLVILGIYLNLRRK